MLASLGRMCAFAAVFGLLGLGVVAGAETAAPGARHPQALQAQRAQQAQARAASFEFERRYRLGCLILAAAGLGAFVLWQRQRSSAPGGRGEKVARVVLVALGIAAYGSYFFFFRFHHRAGLDGRDALHYFVGSKYFSELGHFGLYECTIAALVEEGVRPTRGLRGVRDLRTLQVVSPAEVRVSGRSCSERFTPERWQAFRSEVHWFWERIPRDLWPQFLVDHGYHPTPVWTLLGGSLANQIEVDSLAMWAVIRADRVLVGAGLLALAWGFGPEIGALAAIVWGTGYEWRFGWVGDAYLRHLWLSSALLGLALLRRGRELGGGAALTLSTLLRIFPGVFLASWGAHTLRNALLERRLPAGATRVVAGAGIAALVLIGASIAATDQGIGAYVGFARKMSAFAVHPAANRMGLGVLLDAAGRASGGTLPGALWSGLTAAVILLFGWLYVRCLRRLHGWEAAALGFAWIPLLTAPANYYYSFVVAGVTLGFRRPRAAVWVAVAGMLWGLNGLVFYLKASSFIGASLIAVALSFAVVLELGRGTSPASPPRAAS